MSNTGDFVDLLNREMEDLQKWCQGKKEPQTAVECEDFAKPFVYEIGRLTFENNRLQQRIAELEEQLKNAIVPKFKIGQEVWYIEDNQVNSTTIDDMWIEFNGEIEHYFNLDLSDGFGLVSKTNDEKWEPHFGIGTYYVFATKEEAEAKLEELKGENK